jgi:hypothetical protein
MPFGILVQHTITAVERVDDLLCVPQPQLHSSLNRRLKRPTKTEEGEAEDKREEEKQPVTSSPSYHACDRNR